MAAQGRLRSGVEARLLVLAALVGVLGGLGGVLFRTLVEVLQRWLIGEGDLVDAARALPWWQALLIPTAGAAVASLLLYAIGREKETAGVSDLMEIVSLRKGTGLTIRTTILRALASLGILATGGSVGREGPIIQIGAAFGGRTAAVLGLSGQRLGLLLGCGVASGMAAAYNAPVAGAVFAMELILANFAIDIFAPVALASVSSVMVSRALLGDRPVYEIPRGLGVESLPVEIPAALLLGCIAGAAASFFLQTLRAGEGAFRRIPLPPWARTTLGGLLIGVLGIWAPEVWGNGYAVVDRILRSQIALEVVAGLFVLKMLATATTVGSGGPGGVFTPSLFLGAALGYLYGYGLNAALPGIVAPPVAYAAVGMAGLIAGTTQAPIMAVFILVEMTADFRLVVPLMLGAIAASSVAHTISGESLYTGKLRRRGVKLPEGIEETTLRATRVGDLMRADVTTVSPTEPFEAVLPLVVNTPHDSIYVVDGEGKLKGAIHLQDMKPFLAQPDLGRIAISSDLMVPVPSVTPDRSLADIIETFEEPDLEEVPVVSVDGSGRLVGVVTRRDIIATMSLEVLRSGSLRARFVARSGATDYVELPHGHRVDRVPVPGAMIGRTIEESDFRRTTGLSILVVVREDAGARERRLLPDPSLVLEQGDEFVVLGPSERIDALRAPTA